MPPPAEHNRPMNRVPWGIAAVLMVILVVGFVLRPSPDVWLVPIAVPFTLVGALIASRRRENPIGWLFLAFGGVGTLVFFATCYAHRALVADPGSLPGGNLAANFAVHAWHPGFGLFVFSFLLFPDGRLVSPRWRWVAYVAAADYIGMALAGPFDARFQEESDFAFPVEPLVGGTLADIGSEVFAALLVFNLLLIVVAGASLLVRLRRSSGEERLQVKWFVYAVTVVMVCLPGSVLLTGSAEGILLLPLIPIAAAAAILRYRLYDIDVVINRTLVYGALTAILAGAYLLGVLVLQWALGGVTGDSALAVAGSTLTVAALFRPLRARLQHSVDRRFYRAKYDARMTVDAFAGRLREQVDLDRLDRELTATVREALQPAHVSLWLRR